MLVFVSFFPAEKIGLKTKKPIRPTVAAASQPNNTEIPATRISLVSSQKSYRAAFPPL